VSGISIVYLTYRATPRFDWFVASLARELGDDTPEVIFVDGLHSARRGRELAALVGDRFAFLHVPAKPSPYNGAYRLTQRDYFSAASARNTGIIYASQPYLVFVDDLSVVMPGWWAQVRAAARQECVVTGAYQKHWEMVVVAGELVSSRCEPSGLDSRWSQGDDTGNVRVGGAQLFGASFGAPLALLLELNGCDELCDSIGGEDWQLGVRMEWHGAPIYYSRRMLTIESEELHRQGTPALRIDKLTTPELYMSRLAEFGVTRRFIEGRHDSSHMLLDILFGTQSLQPMGNYYYLPDLCADGLASTVARFPAEHWFDGQPLREL
jgi:hypothetical protein